MNQPQIVAQAKAEALREAASMLDGGTAAARMLARMAGEYEATADAEEVPKQIGEFYGDGTGLPAIHPDKTTNSEILIGALCASLDTALQVLGKVSGMQVVTPALVALRHDVLWALDATHPKTLHEQHPNHG